MSVEITHIRLNGEKETHECISEFKWRSTSGNAGHSTKNAMVDWIKNQNGKAYVGSGPQRRPVGVVHPKYGLPYLRTYADGQWTNNLLALPRF